MRRRSWIANGDAGMCVFCVSLSIRTWVCVRAKGGQAGSWGVEYSRAFSLSKSRRETSLEAWSCSCRTSKRRRVQLNRELTPLSSTLRPQLTKFETILLIETKWKWVSFSLYRGCQSLVTAPSFELQLALNLCLKGRKCCKKFVQEWYSLSMLPFNIQNFIMLLTHD